MRNTNFWKYVKKWKETDIVYGVFEDSIIKYIGKTDNLTCIPCELIRRYKNCCIKELKLGINKKLDWEKIYIQWYGLKYQLDNKNVNYIKVSAKNKMRLLTDYYQVPFKKYKHPVILKYHLTTY